MSFQPKTWLAAATVALFVAPPAWAQVAVTEVESDGGIKAWLVEEPALPFVALELIFMGGASLDPEGEEGATSLMTSMLGLGAGALDEQGFAEAKEAVAAEFSFDAGHDSVSVSARFLTEFRDESVALLRSALKEPRFDADAFERTRARALSVRRSDMRNPGTLASLRFNELAWGDHPYARPVDGTEDSLAALTREALEAAHARALVRDRVFVAAVGDIGPDELGALIDDLLGDLPLAEVPLPGPAEVLFDGGVTVVPFDGPQSVILFGQAGIPRDDDDYFAAFVMNEVLGGGRFGTRLMRELRQARGLTYGVGSFLFGRQFGDTLQGRLSTSNARAAEAIELVRAEWARMAAEGLSEEELEAIQTYMTGEYPLRFDGNARIARILVAMQMQDMPASYMAERNDLVRAVTLEDVRRVADRLLDPEGLHFVVVGQPEGLDGAEAAAEGG